MKYLRLSKNLSRAFLFEKNHHLCNNVIMNFLHNTIPDSVALVIGPITIHWYGIIMALSIVAALLLSLHIADKRGFKREEIIDAAFWLIIGGLIGARLYEIGLEWNYYAKHFNDIVKIWQGGLAIHGALLGGAVALLLFLRHKKYNFWNLAAVFLPGVALGQAIGRWGNWFNQELFGTPSLLPWSIPIDLPYRPFAYEVFTYFHPVFLYESLGLLVIALILYILARRKNFPCALIVSAYLILAGALRFIVEFIKVDSTPEFIGLRWPQLFSLGLIALGFLISIKVIFTIKKAKS